MNVKITVWEQLGTEKFFMVISSNRSFKFNDKKANYHCSEATSLEECLKEKEVFLSLKKSLIKKYIDGGIFYNNNERILDQINQYKMYIKTHIIDNEFLATNTKEFILKDMANNKELSNSCFENVNVDFDKKVLNKIVCTLGYLYHSYMSIPEIKAAERKRVDNIMNKIF